MDEIEDNIQAGSNEHIHLKERKYIGEKPQNQEYEEVDIKGY